MKILIVEDDLATCELLSRALITNRYRVDVANDGVEGVELAQLWEYDLIILDIKLPRLDGLQVCRMIRSTGSIVPILMLTARDSTEDIITGLDAGADDYVVKPFELNHLLARVRSLLRRSSAATSSMLTQGKLCLDTVTTLATYNEVAIALRQKEYALLELLLRYPHRIFSRSAIIDHLWTVDNFPTESAVTNLVKDLRHQLTTAGAPRDLIETVHGFGYRLKTKADAEPLAETKSDSGGDRIPDTSSIEQLSQWFQASAQGRVLQLEEGVQQLRQGTLTEDRYRLMQQESHRLAGSLGMYGYDRASAITRALDALLGEGLARASQRSEQALAWLSELRQELWEQPIPEIVLELDVNASPLHPMVLVVSENDAWAETLLQEAQAWNLRVEVIPDWSPAQQQFIAGTPVAIAFESTEPTLDRTVLRQIKDQFPTVPVLTVAEHDDLGNRLTAAQCGSVRYLTKPLTASQLFETITQLLPQIQPPAQTKVLLVDDDPAIHPLVNGLLRPWGLEVVNLEQPGQFWQVLSQTNPDLVLLDIEMPDFNGIELCQIVRQDNRYSDLPILVITAHPEPAYIRQVFEAGADDLIRKPLLDAEFVMRVISRIERSRLQKQIDHFRREQREILNPQGIVDPLTQIPNRRAFDKFLQQTWQKLQRKQGTLSLILADVDEFKLYNDHYGFRAGDHCLQHIAKAIQHCIQHRTDQVARYGGEEFAIILPDTTLSGALQVAEHIQREIASLNLLHSEQATHPLITLSLGITGTIPAHPKTPENLIAVADEALYAAKKRGRNTYCLYPL